MASARDLLDGHRVEEDIMEMVLILGVQQEDQQGCCQDMAVYGREPWKFR